MAALTPVSAEVATQWLEDTRDALYPPVRAEESAIPAWAHDGLRYVEVQRDSGTIALIAIVNPDFN